MKDLRAKLQATADEIVKIIAEKDAAYGSSWKDHGGFSAFFNLHRKYSRVENMAQQEKFDLFSAMHIYPDGPDSLIDLIAYALLTLSETYTPEGYVDPEDRGPEPEECQTMMYIQCGHVAQCGRCGDDAKKIEDDGAGPEYVNQDRTGIDPWPRGLGP